MGILGVYAMCVPVRTFLGIGWLLGALVLVNGIELLIMGFSGKKKSIGQIILGALEAIGGIILLFSGIQRVLTDVMVAYLIGFFIIIYGVYQIVSACKKYKDAKGSSILNIICGVLSVIVGTLSVGHPIMTMVSVGYLIAIALIFRGIDMIVLAVTFGKKKSAKK